ncbi:IS3 family transposase [Canibacter oris]|uniref:IS3 family transposase n=1 Tax=Canibacter oris TaxID=1365628 RepID=UPI0016133B37
MFCPISEREHQKAVLLEEIRRIHRDDPEFGYLFIADELRAKGLTVSERMVWKLCLNAGIFPRLFSARQ